MAHKLRVTQEPGVVREVDDAELVDLARQGLIHSYEHTDATADALDKFNLKPEVERWKAAKKGEDVVTATPDAATPEAEKAKE